MAELTLSEKPLAKDLVKGSQNPTSNIHPKTKEILEKSKQHLARQF